MSFAIRVVFQVGSESALSIFSILTFLGREDNDIAFDRYIGLCNCIWVS